MSTDKKMEAYSLSQAKIIRLVLRQISLINAFIYELSNGRLWGKLSGKYPIMVLSVFGAKSGKLRKVPLIKVLHEKKPILVASMAGMPMHPSWYFNVSANPRVAVQIGSEKKYYTANQLTDQEKEGVWPTVCAHYPDYDQYKKNTQRNIGVFSCEEKILTTAWKEWLAENTEKGCDKNELYSILYHEGFHPEQIASEMNARVNSFTLQPKKQQSSKEENIQRMVHAFKSAHKEVPKYTEIGFKKETMDKSIHQKILDFYQENDALLKVENVAGGFVKTEGEGSPSHTIEMPDELRDEIHQSFLKRAEAWSGIKLLPTYVYGVRVYNRGATLESHVDRKETHIIGVIMNIDQKVDSPWILEIDDNEGNNHNVTLSPGDIVFYESATVNHGRSTPLDGEKFVNVFCHYMPLIQKEKLRDEA